jgi:hypothetical protein
VPDAARFDNAHRRVRCLEGAHHGLFIAAGGFANDVRAGLRAEEFEELGVALAVIGQGVKTAREMELQRELSWCDQKWRGLCEQNWNNAGASAVLLEGLRCCGAKCPCFSGG